MTTKNIVSTPVRHDVSAFSPDDLYLFNEGRNYRAYNQLGAHLAKFNGEAGTSFSVWAPNARKVSVIGNFNDWNTSRTSLNRENLQESGKDLFQASGRALSTNFISFPTIMVT